METANEESRRSEAYEKLTKKPPLRAGYVLVGLFLPILGLILFGVWHSMRPGEAKSALLGASLIIGLGLIMRFIVRVFVL